MKALSASLPFKEPGLCQQCGELKVPLTYWQECDHHDQPTRVYVVLCQACADQIIEPHPRLYVETDVNVPMPGAMPICGDCRHRALMQCTCPQAKFNGGPGLAYEPAGSMVHVCRSPRSKSGWFYSAPGPVTKCSGKESK